MISNWSVSNFKSIYKETELELRPLTVFAGANSSGKSTFIQSILLIAQTLAHRIGSRSIVLNGAFTKLGHFNDLKSDSGESDEIVIKFTYIPSSPQVILSGRKRFWLRPDYIQKVSCEISFDANPSNLNQEVYQIQPQLVSTRLSCVSVEGQKAHISIGLSGMDFDEIESVYGEMDDLTRSDLSYKVGLDENSMIEFSEDYFLEPKLIGCTLKHFLPNRIIYEIDSIEEDAHAISQALLEEKLSYWDRQIIKRRRYRLTKKLIAEIREVLIDAVDFDQKFEFDGSSSIGLSIESPSLWNWREQLENLPIEERAKIRQTLKNCGDLRERIAAAMKSSEDNRPPEVLDDAPPRQINSAIRYLDKYFSSSLKYLGPLRDEPKPLYQPAQTEDPHDIGLRGEHTASVLELHKNKKIKYIPSTQFKHSEIDRELVSETLQNAVMDWLQYLGVATSVKSLDQGKLGYELKVGLSNSNCLHDLTHVGVGVSQVLPILVMCLLAEKNSTLVFEQPEIHLHPKVQTLLGDFFLSMALCNKQCIVETHSEYFVDRLRYRIAAGSTENELNRQTKIYFVEKDSQESSFREVVINEFGAIPDWPEGFFDQSQKQAENILLAAAKKRLANRSKSDVLGP